MIEFDKEEYKNIKLYKMQDNKNALPVYVRHFCDKDASSGMHRHEMIQINYVTQGKLIHQINNMKFSVVSGDVFVIPPYIPHCLIPEENSPFKIIELEFEPEFLFGTAYSTAKDIENFKSLFNFAYIEPFLVSERDVRPRLNLTGKAQLAVEHLLLELQQEYTVCQDGYLLAIKAIIMQLLVIIGRSFTQNMQTNETQMFSRHRQALEEAMKYSETHFAQPLSVEEVARVAMLSASYFSYLFKTMTGKTFVEHLTNIRLKHAMERLASSSDLVLNICMDVGFNNVNHFNRTFKLATGLSPLQYRKANRQNAKE